MPEEPFDAPAPPVPPAPEGGAPSDTTRLLTALGYPIWVVALILILIEPYKRDPVVRHHAIQALGLNLAVWVLGMGTMWFGLGYLISVAGLVYEIVCAIKAYNGELFKMPVIYDLVKQYI